MRIENFNIEHRLSCLVICLGHTCSLVGYLQRTSSVLGTVWPQWCQCEQGSVLHQELVVEAEKDTAVKSCTGPVRTLCGMLTGRPVSVGHSLAHNLFSLRVPAFLLGLLDRSSSTALLQGHHGTPPGPDPGAWQAEPLLGHQLTPQIALDF